MRLHAGSHVDAPEHNVRGGAQIHELPLALFIGDAIVADLHDKMQVKAISEIDLEKAIGSHVRDGDRVLLRTDHNNSYDGGSDKWMKASPYLSFILVSSYIFAVLFEITSHKLATPTAFPAPLMMPSAVASRAERVSMDHET